MLKEFGKWMSWHGKTYNECELEKGDFLHNSAREKINSAS